MNTILCHTSKSLLKGRILPLCHYDRYNYPLSSAKYRGILPDLSQAVVCDWTRLLLSNSINEKDVFYVEIVSRIYESKSKHNSFEVLSKTPAPQGGWWAPGRYDPSRSKEPR